MRKLSFSLPDCAQGWGTATWSASIWWASKQVFENNSSSSYCPLCQPMFALFWLPLFGWDWGGKMEVHHEPTGQAFAHHPVRVSRNDYKNISCVILFKGAWENPGCFWVVWTVERVTNCLSSVTKIVCVMMVMPVVTCMFPLLKNAFLIPPSIQWLVWFHSVIIVIIFWMKNKIRNCQMPVHKFFGTYFKQKILCITSNIKT